MFGGINGAGKSTLVEAARHAIPDAIVLNPDSITATALAEDARLTLAAAEYRGLRQTLEQIEAAFLANQSIISETVFANQTYLRLMQRAKGLGYLVRLVFIGVPTVEDSIRRVALRVSKGGHDVRESDIRRRWPLTHANLVKALDIADIVRVFINDKHDVNPRLIGSKGQQPFTLYDPEALPAVTAALRGQPIPS